MELNDYLRVLRAYWAGVALLVVLSVVAAFAYSLTQPKVYSSTATGFVSVGDNSNPALGSVADSLAKSRAKSYVDIAKGRDTANDVIQALGLDVDASGLIGRIAVQQPADTVLIKITARAGTPRSAQSLADAWVVALARQVLRIEGSGTQSSGKKNSSGQDASYGLRIVPIEAAALPGAPILPRTNLNLLLGLVVGLLIGVAYAVVRNQLDRRLRSAADVEKPFGVPVVGAIPLADGLSHKPGERAPIAIGENVPSSSRGEGEAFRKLRTNLAYMDVDNPPRVIVVTSPKQGDGKSTVAANTAAAIAASGRAVVLVDADLRRPTVADSFGLAEGVGLTDLLIGRVELADALQTTADLPSLRILAAGRIPPNPSELLGTLAMEHLLKDLAKDALVIIDAPPLLPVTDAAVLTAVADGALVVVSAGQTLDTELRAALGHLSAVNGRALGVVFNRAVSRGDETGYYGGGYYRQNAPVSADG